MSLFRDKGVVLRTYRLGEADKIIVFLTERHGKVRAVAKGIRKTTSKFGGRLEPLTQVDLLLWQGRGDLDIVNQVEVVNAFRPIREDLDRMPRGIALLEVTRPDGPGAPSRTRASTPCWWAPSPPSPTEQRRPDARRALVLLEGARPRRGRPGAR